VQPSSSQDNSEDLSIADRVILECRIGVEKCGLDASGAGYGPVAGPCEDGNESSSFINGGKFLTS
jgi:hypothetical protein